MSTELLTDAEAWDAMVHIVLVEGRRHRALLRQHDLTPQSAIVLGALSTPQTFADLADVVGYTPSAMTNMLKRLADKDLVTVETSEDDRRCRLVHRTAAGDKLNCQYALSLPEAATMTDEERLFVSAYLTRIAASQTAACEAAGETMDDTIICPSHAV